MTFYASAEGIPFADVEIITLAQRCRDIHVNAAFGWCMETDLVNPEKVLSKHFNTLTEPEAYREFVEVITTPEPRVIVGVNAEEVDDNALSHALSLLENVENYSVPSYTEFGSTITITPSEVWQ
jgi:hypothetical protein